MNLNIITIFTYSIAFSYNYLKWNYFSLKVFKRNYYSFNCNIDLSSEFSTICVYGYCMLYVVHLLVCLFFMCVVCVFVCVHLCVHGRLEVVLGYKVLHM